MDDDFEDLFGDGPGAAGNDDNEIGKLLAGDAETETMLNDIMSRPLEVGEKADDAIDYEDISDDDLADDLDEDAQQQSGNTLEADETGEDEDPFADLWNDDEGEPSHQENVPLQSVEAHSQPHTDGSLLGSGVADSNSGKSAQVQFRNPNYGAPQPQLQSQSQSQVDEEDDEETRLQMLLFAQAGQKGNGEHILPAPQTSKEVFDQIWPNFDPDKPPRFASLIPRKRAYFVPRVPLRAPKPLAFNNKVNLDIAPDQEKSFRLPAASAPVKLRQGEEEQGGIVHILEATEQDQESGDDMDLDNVDAGDDYDKIGNTSWADLQIACEHWEVDSLETLSDNDEIMTPPDMSMTQSSPKRRRLGDRENPISFSVYDHISLPSWDDPELATARLSKKIMLDMNDPRLLLDIQQPSADQQKPRTLGVGLGLKRDNRGSLAHPMFKRYNISNDEAYDALKESTQQKVRGTIGHMNIEHSLPALKLQYPFYKVMLSDRELRSFHRPPILFKPGERATVSKLEKASKKVKRHLKPAEAFAEAKDLNVGDNSDLLLAEYSEEYPITLSNFGMGVKLINYYRRSNNEDTYRPKPPFGETQVLLPQDKSPFALFGEVDPGEECLAIHNAMYRAPVFQHDVQKHDFLVSRSTTGTEGSKYYIRNIDNLVVVGQEFPSVEVPGTHARKVTEASKKRLKMLAFRLYRRGQQRGTKQPWVSNEMIKSHLPGTEIAQNRSRMREIMKYVKETGTWEPVAGETIPDEPTLRSWIKPEDICLIDSMHAGNKQLQDAGIKTNEINDDDEGEGAEAAEVQLAPWNTTKNFLNACTGKAMLEVHGRGDPTGRHEGLSMLKISMKGGFRDIGESTTETVEAQAQKENGGHSYNVARQQDKYQGAIRRVWDKQKSSLSSKHTPDEPDRDVDTVMREAGRGRSEAATPSLLIREDETMSQFSRNSANEGRGKKLRITRTQKNDHGEYEERVVIVTDPEVIKHYLQTKRKARLMNMSIDDIKPTGDAELDRQQIAKLKQEYARLTRNIERREGREKAKGVHRSQTGDGTGKGGATPRKCANCGEVGHIKTNKKLCPLLNGQKKQSDTFKDASISSPVAATPLASTPQTAGSPI